MRGDSGVAGEGRVTGIPKFHFWGKYTTPLTNTNSDWVSNASSGLCIIYIILSTTVEAKIWRKIAFLVGSNPEAIQHIQKNLRTKDTLGTGQLSLVEEVFFFSEVFF